MFAEPHDLHHEFPEYHDQIHNLKMSNGHFQVLFKKYDELNHELKRIEQGIETPSDEVVEELKKERLLLKDQIFVMLKGA